MKPNKMQIQDVATEKPEKKVTFARMTRVGSAWQVLAVDLPESVMEKYLRHASDPDLYPNIERKLLVESRKTDFDTWK